MNRDQIERAERTAEFMMQRTLMSMVRRLDDHRVRRELAKRLIEEEDDQAAKYELRMRYYEDHVERMAKARSEYMANLIAEGVIADTPGTRAAEFYVKPAKLKRVFYTEKEFTEQQMEIALRSLEKKSA